jgi:hypothetical protein
MQNGVQNASKALKKLLKMHAISPENEKPTGHSLCRWVLGIP